MSFRTIIVNGAENWKDHRGDFETCPICSHKMTEEEWTKSATTLILKPSHTKSNSVAVLSRCSKCNELSWAHEPLSCFNSYCDDWPEKWKTAVQKEEAKRKLLALRDWALVSVILVNYPRINSWASCFTDKRLPYNPKVFR